MDTIQSKGGYHYTMMWTIRCSHRSWFACALVGLVVCLGGLGLAGCSYPPPTVATPSPSSTIPPLTATHQPAATRATTFVPTRRIEASTPALITRAFANGEITDEQRLLYLAYAIFELSSLPMRFRSYQPWEADSEVKEIGETITSRAKMCSLSAGTQAELRKLFQDEAVKCDN